MSDTHESEALALDDLRQTIDLLTAQAECDMRRKITQVYLRALERDVRYSELRELVDQPFFERVRQSWSKACDFLVDLLEFERPRGVGLQASILPTCAMAEDRRLSSEVDAT